MDGALFHPGHLCMHPTVLLSKEPMFGEDQGNLGELGFELGGAWAAGCLGGTFFRHPGGARKDLASGGEKSSRRRRGGGEEATSEWDVGHKSDGPGRSLDPLPSLAATPNRQG
jgi:hypothetical protein